MITAAEMRHAARAIQNGELIAFPTETVYGLGANGFDARACARIFEVKGRPLSDPLIVHIAPHHAISGHTFRHGQDTSDTTADLLAALTSTGVIDMGRLSLPVMKPIKQLINAFWPGPLTLLLPRGNRIPELVTAGRDAVAVRMPLHPVAQQLIELAGVPIAAPSANRFGHTSPTTAQHVYDDLGTRVSIILDGGATTIGVESTVLDALCDPPRILRHGGITREQIERTINRPLADDSNVVHESTARGLVSPGLLEKHYAPHARLVVVESEYLMLQRLGMELELNHKVGLLVQRPLNTALTRESIQYVVGEDLASIARNLYAGMRSLDSAKVEVILVVQVEGTGIGAAISDRLLRASR